VPRNWSLSGHKAIAVRCDVSDEAQVKAMVEQTVLDKKINPSKVFDLTLPLDQVAEGYRAMDERRAIKTLLRSNGTK
jgi:threonine dehydrogenase-like Zn-dependent dehydrogenase